MELNCTQAAVSQRIRALETIFGQRLFLRKANGVRPTEIAEAYAAHIAEALDQLTTISEGLAGPRPPKRVVVALPVTFAALWVAPRLGRFYETYPDVEVQLDCTIWNGPKADVADFQIRLLGNEHGPGNERLTHNMAHVVCAPATLAKRDGAEPGAFFETVPLINLIAKYDYWQKWLRETGVQRIGNGRRLDVDTGIAALEVAASGNGLALSLECYISGYLAEGRLVKPFTQGVGMGIGHFVLLPADRSLSRSAVAFRDFLIEEARAEGGGSEPLKMKEWPFPRS